jgi:hypothetical protein
MELLVFGRESRDGEQDDHGPGQLEPQHPVPLGSKAAADVREIIGKEAEETSYKSKEAQRVGSEQAQETQQRRQHRDAISPGQRDLLLVARKQNAPLGASEEGQDGSPICAKRPVRIGRP